MEEASFYDLSQNVRKCLNIVTVRCAPGGRVASFRRPLIPMSFQLSIAAKAPVILNAPAQKIKGG